MTPLTYQHGQLAYFGIADEIHVVPLFGPKHICDFECWCHPRMDVEDPDIAIHNVAH